MRHASQPARARQRGMVLIISLLLLVVVTTLAIGMFRSFGIDEKIAGNVREKQLALNSAETAEQFAESWLNLGLGTSPVTCAALVDSSVGQVCNKTLQVAGVDPANAPWRVGGAQVGVTYKPTFATTMTQNSSGTGGNNTYWNYPTFYIAYLGTPAGSTTGAVYQIDAYGYGGSPNTMAVVETTYAITSNAAVNLGDNSR